MYRNILIPIDMAHTEKAADMIAAAKKLSEDDTTLILTHIIPAFSAASEITYPQEIFDMAHQDAKQTLSKIAEAEQTNTEIVIRIGHPANDILSIAKEKNADLILIGSHSPGLADYLLGSTASRVVRHAQCPVFVLR